MGYYKKIIGSKCYLSPIAEEDAENWVRWYNDIEISMPESNVYDVISLKSAKDMVADIQSIKANVLTVLDLETDKAIGLVEIEANLVFRLANFGIVIGEKDYWGKGYGKEATQLALDFAFNFLNIHNIMLGVYAFNQRAYHLYKKIGFKEIGRKREFQTLGGEKFDMIMMDLLSTEYESVYVKPLLQRMEE
ncbi:MAG: GNAT family protein [Spirochaetaceae bacterium]|jgi:RimJ/RimL family protein N-acetyltransferase|nr:GNAT family protein [Spirochaetaceae bacterium]